MKIDLSALSFTFSMLFGLSSCGIFLNDASPSTEEGYSTNNCIFAVDENTRIGATRQFNRYKEEHNDVFTGKSHRKSFDDQIFCAYYDGEVSESYNMRESGCEFRINDDLYYMKPTTEGRVIDVLKNDQKIGLTICEIRGDSYAPTGMHEELDDPRIFLMSALGGERYFYSTWDYVIEIPEELIGEEIQFVNPKINLMVGSQGFSPVVYPYEIEMESSYLDEAFQEYTSVRKFIKIAVPEAVLFEYFLSYQVPQSKDEFQMNMQAFQVMSNGKTYPVQIVRQGREDRFSYD